MGHSAEITKHTKEAHANGTENPGRKAIRRKKPTGDASVGVIKHRLHNDCD
jgi:hypothetical protein